MKIGCTYDLRDEYLRYGFSEEETAECDPVETIQAVVATLESLGHQVERIGGVRKLTACLARGDRWDLVFNFAEGLYGFGREAQVPALLDAFQIPYTFSDALVLALTLHKGMTKHIVRDLGVPTPAFVVVSEESDVEKVNLPYPLFVKPVASGSSVGISAASRVADPSALRSICRQLLRRFHQPAIVESFLAGRELTVGLVGTGPRAHVLGVMEVVCSPEAEPHAYSFSNKQRFSEVVKYRVADDRSAIEAADLARQVWTGLGCRDAGRVDCRCDETGKPYFLEVNPLAGLSPSSDLSILAGLQGMTYRKLIASIIMSASERLASLEAGPPWRAGSTRKNPDRESVDCTSLRARQWRTVSAEGSEV